MKQLNHERTDIGILNRFVVLAGLALLLAACRQTAEVGDAADLAGTYTLIEVDGSPLPATVRHGEATVEVRGGSMVFDPGNTCRSETTFAPPEGSDVIRRVNASFTRQGPELTMRWEGAGTTTGTIHGDRFEMNNEGIIFSYRKQPAPADPAE